MSNVNWTKAPDWAQWHTMDAAGACWWETEPIWDAAGEMFANSPQYVSGDGGASLFDWYRMTPGERSIEARPGPEVAEPGPDWWTL